MAFVSFIKTPEPKNNSGVPITNVMRAYEPISYILRYDNTAFALPPRASVEILINGVAFGSAKDITPVLVSAPNYDFTIDVSDRIQEYMDSYNALPDVREYRLLATPASDEQNAYFQKKASFAIRVTFYVSSGAGNVYQPDGEPPTLSNNLFAINARGNTESLTTLAIFTNPSTSRRYLTNAPLVQSIRLNDSYYLSYWCAKTEAAKQVAKIETYDNANVLIDTAYYDLAASGNIDRVRTIPVGATDINVTASSFFIGGVGISINGAVSRYTIQIGNYDVPTLTFTAQFVEIEFVIDKNRCDYVRVFFLNELGGMDAINFKYGKEQDADEVTFTQYRQNQNGLMRYEKRGATQLETQRQRTLSLRDDASGDILFWYAELSSSPLIAAEYNPNPKSLNSARRAMVLANSPVILYRTSELQSYQLDLLYSNINTSQNN